MPGPTTEVLNEDVRDLRGDFREIRGDVQRIDIGPARVQTEFSFAKWLLGSLLIATVSGIASGIWWAATLNANVKNLEITTSDRFNRLESSMKILETAVKNLEASTSDRFNRLEATVNHRFSRLEASIDKLLEQTKPKP